MIKQKRYAHIDLLESIAIFFVVIYHSTIYTFDILQDNSVVNYLLYFDRTILSTCVPLFFLQMATYCLIKNLILKSISKRPFAWFYWYLSGACC